MLKINETTLIDIERSIGDLNISKSKLSTKKRQLELQLSQYKARVRSSQSRLPSNEYRDICRKQNEIKSEIMEIDNQVTDINNLISKKITLKEEVKLHLKQNGNSNVEQDGTVKTRLIKLRDYYLMFSSDSTRVSSMRIMASQVSEQIEAIIKTL